MIDGLPVTEEEFNNLSMDYATENISDRKYCYLSTKQKEDMNLLNYVNIKIKKSNSKYKITINLHQLIHPEYNKILYGVISSDNGNIVAKEEKQKNLRKDTKRYLIKDTQQSKFNIRVVISPSESYPELLDIEMSMSIDNKYSISSNLDKLTEVL